MQVLHVMHFAGLVYQKVFSSNHSPFIPSHTQASLGITFVF
jgi:hypothetical protein